MGPENSAAAKEKTPGTVPARADKESLHDVFPLAAFCWEAENSPLGFSTSGWGLHRGAQPPFPRNALGKTGFRYDEPQWVPQFPQSWNRYNYLEGSPLEGTDPLGLWPFWIHNAIYALAFGPETFGAALDAPDLEIVEATSFAMDFGAGQQSPALAFEHAMRDGPSGQTIAQALTKATAFIDAHLQSAQTAQLGWLRSDKKGYSPDALVQFAMAVHTLTDSTSPEHEGFQPWTPGLWADTRHIVGESVFITPGEVGGGIALARAAFDSTFPVGFGSGLDIELVQVGWSCVGVTQTNAGGQGPSQCGWYFK